MDNSGGWRGKLKALYRRHEALVTEMTNRGYRHRSPLAKSQATGSTVQEVFLDMPSEQVRILPSKNCQCGVYWNWRSMR